MKVFWRRIHLYLGLAAGLVIMITCLTGAILVFEEELQHVSAKERYYVQPGTERLPIETLIANLRTKMPKAKVTGVRIYSDATRTVEMNVRPEGKDKKEGAKPEESRREGGKEQEKGKGKEADKKKEGGGLRAYANPYTGEIIEVVDNRKTFFFKVMSLHRWLLADDPGKMIVGVSTIIFLFIIITGIILWWPANLRILKQRLKIKTDASFKRVNHDLHLVLGFYSAMFLFVFAFTGLAWSFKWFNDGIYKVTGSPLKNPEPPKSLVVTDSVKKIGFDKVLGVISTTQPDVLFYNINAPKEKDEVYMVSVLRKDAAHETATDAYYIDAYSGSIAGKLLFKDRSTGAKVRSTFKPVHTGAIFGTTSKIIALLACLIGFTLPATGIIMWINRAFKKSGKNSKED